MGYLNIHTSNELVPATLLDSIREVLSLNAIRAPDILTLFLRCSPQSL
jgi:hypothetical protein